MATSVRLLAVALVAALGLVGCGSKFKSICQARAQCEGGNDKDINACVTSYEGVVDVANAYDCADPANKAADCYDKTGHCSNGSYEFSCDAEVKAVQACEEAASAHK
jgi:hypothetical protein